MSGYSGNLLALEELIIKEGSAFLQKPFAPPTLAEVVSSTLDTPER